MTTIGQKRTSMYFRAIHLYIFIAIISFSVSSFHIFDNIYSLNSNEVPITGKPDSLKSAYNIEDEQIHVHFYYFIIKKMVLSLSSIVKSPISRV